MYHRILVAIDGSPTSNLALLEAARMAPPDARVRVVTVAENPLALLPPEAGTAFDPELLHTSLLKAGRDMLERARTLLQHRGLDAHCVLLDLSETPGQSVADALLAEARGWPADVIVLGTHGRGGVRRLLMGSLTETLLQRSPLPLLAVRAPCDMAAGAG